MTNVVEDDEEKKPVLRKKVSQDDSLKFLPKIPKLYLLFSLSLSPSHPAPTLRVKLNLSLAWSPFISSIHLFHLIQSNPVLISHFILFYFK